MKAAVNMNIGGSRGFLKLSVCLGCLLGCLLGLPTAVHAEAESLFHQAERAFMNNRPEEAALLFEEARRAEPGREEIYNYLGLAYQQTGNLNKAAETFQAGIARGGSLTEKLRFNLGNVYMAAGQYQKAAEVFGRVVSGGGPLQGRARLNRANSYLKQGSREMAVQDYTLYVNGHPQDPQAPVIRQLIGLLRKEMEEEARLAEEQRKRREEEERRRKEEKARQEALLSDIMSSLDESSEDTANMSAESEDIEIEEEESGIED